MKNLNLFATFLTEYGPASNYRGETEGNLSPLQVIKWKNNIHSIVSSESIRYGIRETLAKLYGQEEISREKDNDEDKKGNNPVAPAFKYHKDSPNSSKFIDDFFFGYVVATKTKQKKSVAPLRNNIAISTTPFNDETIFHQAPGGREVDGEAGGAGLVLNQVHCTSYQYPFCLQVSDAYSKIQELKSNKVVCPTAEDSQNLEDKFWRWLDMLLTAILQNSCVSGAQTRHLFDYSPVSAVWRLTSSLAPQFPLYCFQEKDLTPDAKQKMLLLPETELYFSGISEVPFQNRIISFSEIKNQILNEIRLQLK